MVITENGLTEFAPGIFIPADEYGVLFVNLKEVIQSRNIDDCEENRLALWARIERQAESLDLTAILIKDPENPPSLLQALVE